MSPDAAAADRNYAVRVAARAWRRSGLIEEQVESQIRDFYPDDRVRVGPVFRVLLFLFTAFAIVCVYALLMEEVFSDAWAAPLAFAMGALSAALTEIQVGRAKRTQGGTEAGTSFLAVVLLAGGLFALLDETLDVSTPDAILWVAATAALFFALAAWRWGISIYGAFSIACFFWYLSEHASARWLWIAGGAGLAWPLLEASRSPRFAPSHRIAFLWALAVDLGALYFALHLGSFDAGMLPGASVRLRPLFIVGTAVAPLVLFVVGVRAREQILLDAGLIAGIASLVTLRFYVTVAPTWIVFTVAGAASIAIALVVKRFLQSGRGRERNGFTAEPLFEDASRWAALEAAATTSTLSPAAPAKTEPGFKGGGGRFGGGGASGSY